MVIQNKEFLDEEPPGSLGIIARILSPFGSLVKRLAGAWSIQGSSPCVCFNRDFIHGRCYAILSSIQEVNR